MSSRLRLSSLAVASLAFAGIGLLAQGCGSSSDSSTFNNGNGANGGTGNGGTAGNLVGGNGNGTGASGSTQCVNLQCQQVACGGGGHTTVSGTVMDPAGKNPLYNVVVYVPNSKPAAFTDHASCDSCNSLYTGEPIVTALTGPDGKFTLQDVPVGTNIPLVIQIGKWRRQITIPTVAQCTDNPLTNANDVRLPRNRGEGDIPKIAVSTGSADSMECLLQRIGVDDAEYGGSASGAGRIHIYEGNGNKASGSAPSETSLWDTSAHLSNYDMVILSCEGGEHGETKPASSLKALEDYANAGGRVFASHFHYYWFEGAGASTDFSSTATWFPGSNTIPVGDKNGITSAAINTGFPKGQAFQQWMKLTNALQPDGTLQIQDSRQNASVGAANAASTSWIADTTVPTAPSGGETTMYFTFNTPTTVKPDAQCGRVVFSDLHVGAASNDYSNGSKAVPGGCAKGDLSPQEKALEFMLFDLSSCVTPDNQPPTAPPGTPPVVK